MAEKRNPDEIIREYKCVNDEVAKAVHEYLAEATPERRRELCQVLRRLDQKGGSLMDDLDASLQSSIQ